MTGDGACLRCRGPAVKESNNPSHIRLSDCPESAFARPVEQEPSGYAAAREVLATVWALPWVDREIVIGRLTSASYGDISGYMQREHGQTLTRQAIHRRVQRIVAREPIFSTALLPRNGGKR